jgi:hypothetical protein
MARFNMGAQGLTAAAHEVVPGVMRDRLEPAAKFLGWIIVESLHGQ